MTSTASNYNDRQETRAGKTSPLLQITPHLISISQRFPLPGHGQDSKYPDPERPTSADRQ